MLFSKLFLKTAKKNKLKDALGQGETKGTAGKDFLNAIQTTFPHVQPKRWLGFDRVRDDAHMLKRLLIDSVDYFKHSQNKTDEVVYDSRDDYLRKEKLTPAQLKKQLKRFSIYALICYGLAAAILVYMVYILVHVSILDGVVCSFFAFFVLAKGLQFNLFVRQIKQNNFKMKLKDLFSK
jgi:hypothetical protein